MTSVPLLTLNDGLTAPQLGLGVWQVEGEKAADIVQTALDAGYRAVDTAAMYRNEPGVGEGIRRSGVAREDVYLTTKLGNGDHGFDAAMKAFDASLERLGTDYVDLYLMHWPLPMFDNYVETWKAMVQMQKDGKARSIGVSNFEKEHLERIIGETGVVPAVNQIELHPKFQQKAMRAYHQTHDIITESWSPLGSGRLIEDPGISKIAEKHGKSVPQTIIRFLLQEGLMVIPKSATPERIRANFDVFDFTLDEADVETLRKMDSADGRNGPHPSEFDWKP
ncbi:aldo/keto reductase [Cucumibacter marinus]|uniref:aldo/keto reductase n=1 Tax=Cucumibacter marinus TaxID=1121252 RepID=UPI00040F18B7|nr:aldo/keto reductase [Cucumibacter marinus]